MCSEGAGRWPGGHEKSQSRDACRNTGSGAILGANGDPKEVSAAIYKDLISYSNAIKSPRGEEG